MDPHESGPDRVQVLRVMNLSSRPPVARGRQDPGAQRPAGSIGAFPPGPRPSGSTAGGLTGGRTGRPTAESQPNSLKRRRRRPIVMGQSLPQDRSNPYLGWIAGGAIVAVVLLGAAALWIHYHG